MQSNRALELINADYPRFSRQAILGIVVLALASPVAWAQQADAPKKPDFATIRKSELAPIDRNDVEKWVNSQIQELFKASSDKELKSQGYEFYRSITQSVRAADATPRYREGVAAILAEAFVNEYKKAPSDRRPLAVVYPLMALNAAAQPTPRIIEAFTLALSEPTPGGRLLGAAGLLAIRGQLNQQQWNALLPALQKAGSDETSGPALARIYELLALPANPAPPVDTTPVVMAILDARLARMAQGNGWPMAADADAIQWLGGRMSTLANPQLQDRAALLIARMMTHAVYAYAKNSLEDVISGLEVVVLAAEAQLGQVVNRRASGKRPPSVTNALLDGGAERTNRMLAELKKWIGTDDEPGLLNEAPFNFDVGLKIPPPTVTAAATENSTAVR